MHCFIYVAFDRVNVIVLELLRYKYCTNPESDILLVQQNDLYYSGVIAQKICYGFVPKNTFQINVTVKFCSRYNWLFLPENVDDSSKAEKRIN